MTLNENTEQVDGKAPAALATRVRTRITEVAARATDDIRAFVAAIIAKARAATERSVEIIDFAPEALALIFLEHNRHNRDWRPGYTESLERAIVAGEWQENNASIGFYLDGDLGDGQHRTSAHALAGRPFKAIVVYGMQPGSIVTVDTVARRTAGDAGKMEGLSNARRKQAIVKTTAAYLTRAGRKDAALTTETRVLAQIKQNDMMLTEAIRIGSVSTENIVQPVLKEQQAETLAYLLLQAGWPSIEVHANLTLFQSGQSTTGEKTPFFVAAEWITDARKNREAAKRLSSLKEIGVVVEAIRLATSGVTAIRRGRFEAAVKKELPDPNYQEHQEAVA